VKDRLLRAWAAWKRVAHWIGEKQATLIYSVLYYLVIVPVGLLRRPFTDPFQYRRRSSPSFWVARPPAAATLDDARRM
jgi:hypothetical protein